jgi:hypothetical protein
LAVRKDVLGAEHRALRSDPEMYVWDGYINHSGDTKKPAPPRKRRSGFS